MSNYKFTLIIEPKDIYNRLLPEQKEQINNVKITDVTLRDNGSVEIECLALKDEIIEYPYLQRILDDGYVSVVKHQDFHMDSC